MAIPSNHRLSSIVLPAPHDKLVDLLVRDYRPMSDADLLIELEVAEFMLAVYRDGSFANDTQGMLTHVSQREACLRVIAERFKEGLVAAGAGPASSSPAPEEEETAHERGG